MHSSVLRPNAWLFTCFYVFDIFRECFYLSKLMKAYAKFILGNPIRKPDLGQQTLFAISIVSVLYSIREQLSLNHFPKQRK